MLPTEIQRILLLIGLAATGYLMILAWNEDYVQGVAQSEVISATPSLAPDVVDVPAATATTTDSDLPEPAISEAGQPASTTITDQAETAESRLIRVETPTLVVWLDRLGGDIVRVQLPKFPLDIEAPDDPFVILNQGDGRIYVAQSGLVGADGVDEAGDRPLYSAAKTEFVLEDSAGDLVVELTAEKKRPARDPAVFVPRG